MPTVSTIDHPPSVAADDEPRPTMSSAQGRRALVRSAMDGMNRFKQSWVSVMLIKAGIGLGQVVALVILLILSCIIPSPLDPSRSQSHPSPQCPHPRLFRSWMWVQIVRLFTCWAVSCWMLVRSARLARLRRRESAGDEEGGDAEGNAQSSRNGEGARAGREEEAFGAVEPGLSHSTTTTPASECPPIISSSPTPVIGTTTPCLDLDRLDLPESNTGSKLTLTGVEAEAEAEIEGMTDILPVQPYGSAADLLNQPAANHEKMASVQHAMCRRQSCGTVQAARVPLRSAHSNRSLRGARRMAQQRLHPQAPVDSGEEANGDAGETEGDARGRAWKTRIATTFDRYALTVSRGLGGISMILFVLGNILVFHPRPSAETCYGASPLLWWGVMLVVGIGYILLAQIFFVVVIVGLGGAVVLDALRRIGILPVPPTPEPPRPPQPKPLTPTQVAQIPVLSYVPHFSASPAHDTSSTEKAAARPACLDDAADAAATAGYDVSRLPYPPIFLAPHTSQSTCMICQESYVAPREERAILLKVDRLKKLGCGHVYHMDCIDEWLLKGSANCPACNSPVTIDLPPARSQQGSGSTDPSDSRRGSMRNLSIAAQRGLGTDGQERRRSSMMSALQRFGRP